MDKCPSDFISLVKICVLIQSLELILERGGLVERENPVPQPESLHGLQPEYGETYFGRCLRLYNDHSLIVEIMFVFSPQVFDEVVF